MGCPDRDICPTLGGHPHGTFRLIQHCVADLSARKARALFQTLELFYYPKAQFDPFWTRTSTSCDLEPGPLASSRGDTLVQLTPSLSLSSRGWDAPAVVRATAAALQFLLAIKFCIEPQ